IYIAQPGYYPCQTVWFEGQGGANLEWAASTMGGAPSLINGNAADSIKAYQVATGTIPPAVTFVDPVRDSGNPYGVLAPITVDIADGSTPVNAGSVKLLLNGTDTGATAVDTAEGATITYTPTTPYPSGATMTVGIEFDGYSGEYDFTVPSYTVLPAMLATAIGTGGQPGMTWRTHQTSTGRNNNVGEREQQLVGALGASIHDPAGEVDGRFLIDFVNFEQDAAEAGNFTASAAAPQDVPDTYLPGIPSGHAGGTDNIAAECEAFVQFDTPGFKTMVVNSDDGFHVTSGVQGDSLREKKYVSLGIADYGKGASDVVFNIWVEQAGVYYLRLLWFEGGGGANCEWFTVNQDGSRALVGGTQTGSLKAYRTRTVAEPALPAYVPASIGLNFAADEAAGTSSGSLAAADVAGAFPQANWNNLNGAAGSTAGTILNADGVGTGVVVAWNSPNTWSSTGRGEENNCLTGADNALLTGYLDTNNDSTTTVRITGIPATESYDLYLYAQGGVVGRGGAYRVLDAITGAELQGYRQVQTPECPAGWMQAMPNATTADWEAGNFLLFCDMNATDIVIEATTQVDAGTGADLGYPAGGTQRASLNGAQLVFPATCQPPVAPQITSIVLNEDGSITITWDGDAVLEAAESITGPWQEVTGATSPYNFTPDAGVPVMFGRLRQ
ncbi:MAG: hypothetical protein H7A47_18180, partial [Verrucomicrobiales bacterium]|nr:hypothetical protein [Verrucomicrobiales bacterium]